VSKQWLLVPIFRLASYRIATVVVSCLAMLLFTGLESCVSSYNSVNCAAVYLPLGDVTGCSVAESPLCNSHCSCINYTDIVFVSLSSHLIYEIFR
jgi:hypothetical protein